MLYPFLNAFIGAAAWRLRGGAFTTITKIDLGTDFARLIGAAGLAAPLALEHGPLFGLVTPAVFIGLLVTGWGPFQGLGLKSPYAPERSWLRWLPLRLGLPTGSVGHDAVGLAEAGLVLIAPSAALLAALCGPLAVIPLVVAGLLFPLAYGIPRVIRLPSWPRVAVGQDWGEVFVGALLALAFHFATSGIFK